MSKTTDKVIELAQEELNGNSTVSRKKLKSINIKGKPYITVDERLLYFRETYGSEYSLITEVIKIDENFILMKTTIKDSQGREVATGHAYEEKDSSYINKTSYVENCETSSWGRALANFGIGIDNGAVASADEVINAINNQNKIKERPNIKFEKGGLKEDQFKRAIKAIKEGDYTKEKLLKTFELTSQQLKTLESC